MDSCKRFDDLVARLHELLLEGEVTMTSEKRSSSVLKSFISSLNSVYLELERLSLQEQDEEKRGFDGGDAKTKCCENCF